NSLKSLRMVTFLQRTFTSLVHTHAGRTQGETVEVQGQLEISTDGHRRIVVGSDREALGEYIKVLCSQDMSAVL
ncbi:MAG: hypothetical protein KZQ78_08695, partial [Candidatus Thiodiazotropha sp. (ex Ustalcina ferruginea)]|nr:hypothetical protein [Candidatus Thiodiazotropha sp. (ex Ustalcina ferruginea)]